MAAAMCTSMPHDHYFPQEEPPQQLADMDEETKSIEIIKVIDDPLPITTNNSAFIRLPDEIVEQ